MSDPILELLAAPPNPPMSVDEYAVHAGGRRRLRRRTLRRTGIGVVGVVGAAAIAFGTLGADVDNDALPAGPSPTSVVGSRASADVLDGRYAVEVVPNAPSGQPNVIFYAIKDGRRQQLAGSDASPGRRLDGDRRRRRRRHARARPPPPRPIPHHHPDDRGQWVASRWTGSRCPGTDFQAVAIDFETARDPTATSTPSGSTPRAIVRHANGTLIPSVLVPGTQDRLFVDQESGPLMGVLPVGRGAPERPGLRD